MTFDETWDDRPSRRVASAPMLAATLGLAACVLAGWVWHEQRGVAADRKDLQTRVAALESRMAHLSGRDAALASRLGSAEKTLKRRETGIAPLANRVLRSVFTVETDDGLGTGFVAWQDGDSTYLLTAAHVVEGQASGTVTITRKKGSWSGEVQGIDEKNDLAVIRVNGRPAGAKPLWQDPHRSVPHQGDELVLIGSPFGYSGTVTTGVVSRVTPREIQTDAAANPGNSGGPALTKDGRIVGVLVAGIFGGQGVNFAVRVDRACVKLRSC
jgi:S1-C subfamily serine protease